jgi:hypothetical protein
MTAEEDAAARRAAWIAAGAPDYNAPTVSSSGQVTGYVSVAAEPQSARSESNQGLQIVNGQVVDTQTGQAGPYYPPTGTIQWINQPAQPVQQPPATAPSTNTGPATASNPDDQLVSTCKGTMTVGFLRSQLQGAGYPGPWDTASMIAAFNRAACPTLGGGTSGTAASAAPTTVGAGNTGPAGETTAGTAAPDTSAGGSNILLYGVGAILLIALLGRK